MEDVRVCSYIAELKPKQFKNESFAITYLKTL
jgi:hypothetical protein